MNTEQERLSFLKFTYPVGGENFNSEDYLHCHGNAGHAILYSTLFLPAMEEVCGSVLLSGTISDKGTRNRFETLRKDAENPSALESLEASFNFIELGYQFSGRSAVSEKDESLLATMVAESWSGILKVRYPTRSFTVEILSPEVTGSITGIHFFENRKKS